MLLTSILDYYLHIYYELCTVGNYGKSILEDRSRILITSRYSFKLIQFLKIYILALVTPVQICTTGKNWRVYGDSLYLYSLVTCIFTNQQALNFWSLPSCILARGLHKKLWNTHPWVILLAKINFLTENLKFVIFMQIYWLSTGYET